MKKIFFLATIIILTFCSNGFGQGTPPQKNVKVTAAEVLSRHLASIGTSEALAKTKSRVMVGNVRLTPLRGFIGSQLSGPAQIASVDGNLLLVMILNSKDYPHEKVAFNGKEVTVGKMPGGERTALGEFLQSNNNIVKQGIFGGTLSSGWVLLDLDDKKGKLEYAGQETIDNHKLHKLKYSSSKTGTLRINLYFDAETYRHVLSEYQYTVEPTITSNPTDSVRLREKRYTLVERFTDFVKVEGLTLPQTYGLKLTTEEEQIMSLEWIIKISQFYFKETLDAGVFKVS